MAFSCKVRLFDVEMPLEWDNGELAGNPLAVDAVKLELATWKKFDGQIETYNVSAPAEVSSALGVLMAILLLFPAATDFAGDVPQTPTVPEDAVA